MSIDYYAVTKQSALAARAAGCFVPWAAPSVDVARITRRLEAEEPDFERAGARWFRVLTGSEELSLERDGGYVQVDVARGGVIVSCGFNGGQEHAKTFLRVLAILRDEKLFVFDPQDGNWVGP